MTVPKLPPLTVTVFTPPLLVTVTVTLASAEVVPVPSIKVEDDVKVLVEPAMMVLSPVSASNAQGFTVMVVGATMSGIVETVTLKMHEPKANVPVAVPVPAAIENPGAVVPSAGAVNLTVVASAVPNAGTPAGKLKPVDTAVKALVASVAVAAEMVRAGMSFTAMVVAGEASPPPQATSPAASVRPKANLASLTPAVEENFCILVPLLVKVLTHIILKVHKRQSRYVCSRRDKEPMILLSVDVALSTLRQGVQRDVVRKCQLFQLPATALRHKPGNGLLGCRLHHHGRSAPGQPRSGAQ